MLRWIHLAPLLVFLGLAGPPATAARGPHSTEATASPMSHVRQLAGRIGPRPAGTAGERRAVRYVRRTFESLGYSVSVEEFRLPQGGRSSNVVARRPSTPAETPLLVGGHLDTVRGSPGGNDNASGVAVLLSLAGALAPEDADDITFVAFGAEEFQPGTGEHHIGSAAHVRGMTDAQRDDLRAMISADMIGKVRRPIVARLTGTDRGASRLLAEAVRDAGMRPSVRTLGDISDHGPFARAGLPAAFLWTGDEPNHHQPTDVVANVSPRALRRGLRILQALLDLIP
ncbi:MAG: M28 family peptidase [Actinomycetota bacterium]|nr:M28 family peptidase [Actinomycetota bacterium]